MSAVILGFLRMLVMFNITVSAPLSIPLGSILHGLNYTVTNLATDRCTIQIANVYPENGLFVKSVEIFVSPSYLDVYKHEFLSFIKKLIDMHYKVVLVKLNCDQYPELNDSQLARVLKEKVRANLCYGWGPEALYCSSYGKGTKVLDNPMGSYEYLEKEVDEFGVGGYLALNYLLENHRIIRHPLRSGIFVNNTLIGFSDPSLPTLAWFGNLPQLLSNLK